MEYPYSLQIKLESTQYEQLRREAIDKGILVNDVVQAVIRAYNAQNRLPALQGLTLPEIVIMMQCGEISDR